MKELNVGDVVYNLNKESIVVSLLVTEKHIIEKIYNNTYSKEITYVACKHPTRISFYPLSVNFKSKDGTMVFTSKEDLLKYTIDQLELM